jgi:hypothetical protein
MLAVMHTALAQASSCAITCVTDNKQASKHLHLPSQCSVHYSPSTFAGQTPAEPYWHDRQALFDQLDSHQLSDGAGPHLKDTLPGSCWSMTPLSRRSPS